MKLRVEGLRPVVLVTGAARDPCALRR